MDPRLPRHPLDHPRRRPPPSVPPSLPATRSTGATGYYIDLSPLLRDPATSAALRANGALLHLVRTTETTSPVTWTISTPSLLTIPAAPAISSMTLSSETLALDTVDLDPALDYTLQTSPTLTPPSWTNASPVPRTGTLILSSSTNPSVFYRLHAAP